MVDDLQAGPGHVVPHQPVSSVGIGGNNGRHDPVVVMKCIFDKLWYELKRAKGR